MTETRVTTGTNAAAAALATTMIVAPVVVVVVVPATKTIWLDQGITLKVSVCGRINSAPPL